MNEDLKAERLKSTFDVEMMTDFINGGSERTKYYRELRNLVVNDKDLDFDDDRFLSREECYELAVKKSVTIIEKLKEYGIEDMEGQSMFKVIAAGGHELPFGLHDIMFRPAINGQGTEEQIEKWIPLAENYTILGTYAQTEIGHGTFLRGLETTATYDRDREEFVLNTPTLTATKFWPGGLGKTSNYAIVPSQLYIDGKCQGLHNFIVQLRSLEDHSSMPGITIGDIGPKNGYASIDNGYLAFDNVRIPRDQMLMKHAEVRKDGTYSLNQGAEKMSYGTMVLVRSVMVFAVARNLAKSCTIAIRYSAVRRQGQLADGDAKEIQILDYATQQQKLLPLLAASYMYMLVGLQLRVLYVEMTGRLDLLPQLHAVSAGLKAVSTDVCSVGIEICRMACGGHGFSQASGFLALYESNAPACTYEGDNTVMLLQTARYLIKCHRRGDLYSKSSISQNSNDIPDKVSLQKLCQILLNRSSRLIKNTSDLLDKKHSWNDMSIELVTCAKAHIQYFIVEMSTEILEKSEMLSLESRKVVEDLFQLYAINEILQCSGDFASEIVEKCRQAYRGLLKNVRIQAVSLADAFDFSDRELNSALGIYNGNVYEELLKWSKSSPLNKTDVHPAFHKYIKNFLEENRSKL